MADPRAAVAQTEVTGRAASRSPRRAHPAHARTNARYDYLQTQNGLRRAFVYDRIQDFIEMRRERTANGEKNTRRGSRGAGDGAARAADDTGTVPHNTAGAGVAAGVNSGAGNSAGAGGGLYHGGGSDSAVRKRNLGAAQGGAAAGAAAAVQRASKEIPKPRSDTRVAGADTAPNPTAAATPPARNAGGGANDAAIPTSVNECSAEMLTLQQQMAALQYRMERVMEAGRAAEQRDDAERRIALALQPDTVELDMAEEHDPSIRDDPDDGSRYARLAEELAADEEAHLQSLAEEQE